MTNISKFNPCLSISPDLEHSLFLKKQLSDRLQLVSNFSLIDTTMQPIKMQLWNQV